MKGVINLWTKSYSVKKIPNILRDRYWVIFEEHNEINLITIMNGSKEKKLTLKL